jgi:hypothetical protein
MTPCILVAKYWHVKQTCYLHPQGLHTYQTTQHLSNKAANVREHKILHSLISICTDQTQSYVLLSHRLISVFKTLPQNTCLGTHCTNPNNSRICMYYCKLQTRQCDVKPEMQNCKIWGSHCSEHKDHCLLECNAIVWQTQTTCKLHGVTHPRRLIFMQNHHTQ